METNQGKTKNALKNVVLFLLQLLILLQSLKFSISWVCYRRSRVEKQSFSEVYVNLVMFIFSKTDLGVLIKQQMRHRKELVKFSTTVIF